MNSWWRWWESVLWPSTPQWGKCESERGSAVLKMKEMINETHDRQCEFRSVISCDWLVLSGYFSHAPSPGDKHWQAPLILSSCGCSSPVTHICLCSATFHTVLFCTPSRMWSSWSDKSQQCWKQIRWWTDTVGVYFKRAGQEPLLTMFSLKW